MSKEKEEIKPYKPEEPVDKKTIKRDQKEIRDAAKHAAQQAAAEELGDEPAISRAQAEAELQEAARKVREAKQKH